jgi:uncharacterized membrane protein (UPF0127 family)
VTDPQPEASGPSPAADQPDRRRWAIRLVALVLIVVGVTLLVHAANRPKDPYFKPAVRTALPGFGELSYRIDTMSKTTRCALLADTPQRREQGLMHVTDATLGNHDGMLFLFQDIQHGAFWMKDTILPLSIAYFGPDGRLVSTTDMAPCLNRGNDCPGYPAGGPFKYALEVAKGGLGRLGIGSGAHISVGGGCP